jgi:hypothetical protein
MTVKWQLDKALESQALYEQVKYSLCLAVQKFPPNLTFEKKYGSINLLWIF